MAQPKKIKLKKMRKIKMPLAVTARETGDVQLRQVEGEALAVPSRAGVACRRQGPGRKRGWRPSDSSGGRWPRGGVQACPEGWPQTPGRQEAEEEADARS